MLNETGNWDILKKTFKNLAFSSFSYASFYSVLWALKCIDNIVISNHQNSDSLLLFVSSISLNATRLFICMCLFVGYNIQNTEMMLSMANHLWKLNKNNLFFCHFILTTAALSAKRKQTFPKWSCQSWQRWNWF